jgi:hypothetical protein
MDKISRRKFLKLVGGSSVALVGGAMFTKIGLPGQIEKDALTFRAVAGLPTAPLPSYASYVIEGGVNLASKTGVVTKGVFAGSPDATSNLALPGLTRNLRVTDVSSLGGVVRITAEVADPSVLLKGEAPTTTITIDTSSGTARAEFLGREVELQLA